MSVYIIPFIDFPMTCLVVSFAHFYIELLKKYFHLIDLLVLFIYREVAVSCIHCHFP